MAKVRGGRKAAKFIRDAKAAYTGRVNRVEVGFFESSRYPDGTPVAAVAAWNEFGTGRIPERPFMRNAIKMGRAPLVAILREHVDHRTMAVDNRVGGLLGTAMQGQIQRSITTLRSPPNAPSTIRAKRSSNPLLDTGVLRSSVSWEISR